MGHVAVAAAASLMAGQGFSGLRTSGGFSLDELVSLLQKSCRRASEPGDAHERAALAVARELEPGYGAYLWRRLKVIAAEDVGLAAPDLPATLEALFAWYVEAKKTEKGRTGLGNSALFVAEAVLLLCRSPKSRLVDDALAVIWVGEQEPLTIPDFALDSHTARGRQLGRHGRSEAEYASSYSIANEADVVNTYAVEAKARDLAPTHGSRRWLLGALHVEYARLDAVHGDGRRWALELAGGHFGRLLSSSRELSDDEATWLLECVRAERTD